MRAAIAQDHAWAARQFPDSPRYGIELDPRRYRRLLAREFARGKVARPFRAAQVPGASAAVSAVKSGEARP